MTNGEQPERQIFVSPRGSRTFVVRALAAALLLPAAGWTAGLVVGGTGAAVLPRLPGIHRSVFLAPSSVRAREAAFDRSNGVSSRVA